MSEIPTFGDLAVTLDAWFDLQAFPDDAGNGWKTVVAKPSCTNMLSPSDPQKAS